MRSAIRKAVFPAAGLGTRFLPATKAQPKEMLPLVDKPIIQYGVEEAVASGVDNIILVTGRGKNAIEDHFDVSVELETFLEVARQARAARRGPQDLEPDQLRVRAPGRAARPRPRGARHARARRRRALRGHPGRRRDRRDAAGAEADDRRLRARCGGPVLCVERVPRDEISSYGVIAVRARSVAAARHVSRDRSRREAARKRRRPTSRSSAATSSRPTSSRRSRRPRRIAPARSSSRTA